MRTVNPNATKYIGLVLGSLIAVLALCLFLQQSCHQPEQETKKANATFDIKPPVKYTDEGGTVHTENEVAQAADIEGINNYYQGIIDSLMKVIKNKPKAPAVQNLVLAGTETNGSFKPKIDTVYLDTNHYEAPIYTINYKDKWLQLKGYVNADSPWTYLVVDSIGLVTYWHRKHWYSKKQLLIDGFSFNPNTHLTGLTAIKLNAAQPKKWGIGFMVGYGVGRDFTLQPFVGVGIQRNFIRF